MTVGISLTPTPAPTISLPRGKSPLSTEERMRHRGGGGSVPEVVRNLLRTVGLLAGVELAKRPKLAVTELAQILFPDEANGQPMPERGSVPI